MHFDSFATMAGRHLIYAYVTVAVVQLGYLGWVLRSWVKLGAEQKKQRSQSLD